MSSPLPKRSTSPPLKLAPPPIVSFSPLLSEKIDDNLPLGAALGARVARFLRLKHPCKTIHAASTQTGISSKTLEKYLDASRQPRGVAVLRFIDVYGPAFLMSVMDNPPKWIVAADRAEREAAIRAEIERIASLKRPR